MDQYALERGLKRDPKKARGHFVGDDEWVQAMRGKVAEWVRARKQKDTGSGTDPPDTS